MADDLSDKLIKNGEDQEQKLKDMILNENKKLWVVAGPAILTRFSTFGVNIISLAFIGHIGATELAAYSLIFTVLLRFSIGILIGMASALETLCGQSYGAKQCQMLGLHLQRSWIVLTITTTLLLPIFLFTTPILKALGQQHDIAQVAGIVSLWFIPVVYAYVVSLTCQMYLQAQSKNMVIAYLAAITLIIHVFLSWLLTIKFKFGLSGAMVSTILAFWIPNIGQLVFIMGGWCNDTWTGFTFLAFKDLWPVVKLSLSSGVMFCIELWYNSILVLLTGNFKNAKIQIDALSICLGINGWEMMIALGFMNAACVRVANELGRGSSKAAKFSIMTIVLISSTIGFILFLFFFFLRGRLAYVFTKNEDVVEAVDYLSPLLAFSILLNSVQPVLSGVAVGAGWQSIVAYVNIGCYYLLGIPIGVLLGYVLQLQVGGVWIGMLIGTLVQTIVLLIITFKTDWDKQVTLAQQRVKRWSVEDDNNSTLQERRA
ncbi:protein DETOXIFICATION 21 [Capsicum annuum]|uniref:protein DETOXIFICATION 21 n=1 Tax=Capsicum annuum TaxID=4072 RepID=UPI001FB1684B|nr:protein DETOXIFICATION 21 [Capsicum annuum]XP_047265641.1 protein DETOXIFICATION 21 [Capsicum annuum]XP_047265642.1 protein DETOXIFICATION 21 [Capsicum annuum]